MSVLKFLPQNKRKRKDVSNSESEEPYCFSKMPWQSMREVTGWECNWLMFNEAQQIVYILKFKRSIDRSEGFLEVKEAEANEQHKIIIGALRTAVPKCKFSRLTLWWVTADWLLKAISKPSSKGFTYKKDLKQRQTLRRSCDTGMRSAWSGHSVHHVHGVKAVTIKR